MILNITYVIPHYENIEGLTRLLKSIELLNDDRIIVIDDNSSDWTKRELRELTKQESFQLIMNQINGGAGSCRNIGLKNVTTDYVIFADSDDFFIENYRTVLNSDFRKKMIDYDFVFFKVAGSFETKNNSIRKTRELFLNSLIQEYQSKNDSKNKNELLYNFVVPWSKMYKTAFLIENNISFQEVSVSNDVLFSTKVGYYCDNFFVCEEPIYNCVERNNSMTSDVSIEKILLRIDVLGNRCDFLNRRLSKEELRELDFSGTSYIALAVRNHYSMMDLMRIIKGLRKNKIKIISMRRVFNYFFKNNK